MIRFRLTSEQLEFNFFAELFRASLETPHFHVRMEHRLGPECVSGALGNQGIVGVVGELMLPETPVSEYRSMQRHYVLMYL